MGKKYTIPYNEDEFKAFRAHFLFLFNLIA